MLPFLQRFSVLVVLAVTLTATAWAGQNPPGSVYHITTDAAGADVISLVPAISHPPEHAAAQHPVDRTEPARVDVKQVMYTTPALKVSVPPAAPESVDRDRASVPQVYEVTGRSLAPPMKTVDKVPPCPSGLGHAPDYSWLVGELTFSRARGTWTVRFAPVDEEDRYGGSVTLVGVGDMSRFSTGQLVRLKGHLIDPNSRKYTPLYHAASICPMDAE